MVYLMALTYKLTAALTASSDHQFGPSDGKGLNDLKDLNEIIGTAMFHHIDAVR